MRYPVHFCDKLFFPFSAIYFLVCITLKAVIILSIGENLEDPKREEMSPSCKQNSAYVVQGETFCSSELMKYFRTRLKSKT